MDWRIFLLVPVVMAVLYWLAAAVCVSMFMRRRTTLSPQCSGRSFYPFVSLLKPVCGLEKNLKENLETACSQDYPGYEVVFGLQQQSDPAFKIVREVAAAYPECKTRIVVDASAVGPNGKVGNLHNMSKIAEGDVFVVSDSDMTLAPDYLQHIVAPLEDEHIGISCTLYRAKGPENLFEVLELLSYNADFVVSILFATVTQTALACPGATLAVRRQVLDAIGGLATLGDCHVEDYELGRRVARSGYRLHIIPYVVAMDVDLSGAADWWRHQVGWDQKTKSANPLGFFFTLLIRGVPFALLYAVSGAPYGFYVFLTTVFLRIVTGLANATFMQDMDGRRHIWLLPIRDLFGLFVWLTALCKRTTSWRGRTYRLNQGRLIEKEQ